MKQDMSIRLDEINIRVVIKDLLQNLIFILMAVAAGYLAVSSYYSLRWVPEYTSSATLAVMARGGSGNTYSNLNTANVMADVLSEVFKSSIMKTEIVKAAGEEAEAARISASLIPETNLISLSVTAKNPEMAFDVMEVVLENYHSVSDYVFSNAVMEVIANPAVPVAPSNIINTKKKKLMGAAAGFLLSAMLFALFSLLRGTAKSVREAKHRIEGECIGTINHEEKNRTLRARLKQITRGLLITNPTAGFRFVEGFHQLAVRIDYQMSKKGQKVLLVNSVAENEGKSTVAANLALALAKRNKKVMLVDLDFRKPAQYKLFDLQNEEANGFLDFLESRPIQQKITRYDEKNHLYQVFNQKAVKNAQSLIENGNLERFLNNSRMILDYVILDAAPFAVGTDAQRVNELSDASQLVVRQDLAQVSDINDTIEMLREGNSDYLGYVLNDFDFSAGSGSSYGYGRYGSGHYGNDGKTRQPDVKRV